MARITKKQMRHLQTVLADMERASNYIMKDTVAVACKGKNDATTILHYSRADGSTLYEVNKGYGSDLCGLEQAINSLASFIVRMGQ